MHVLLLHKTATEQSYSKVIVWFPWSLIELLSGLPPRLPIRFHFLMLFLSSSCNVQHALTIHWQCNNNNICFLSEVKKGTAVKPIHPVYRLCHHNTSTWPQTLAGAKESNTIGHMTHTRVPQRSLRCLWMPSSLADSLSCSPTGWDICDVTRPQATTVKARRIYWNIL